MKQTAGVISTVMLTLVLIGAFQNCGRLAECFVCPATLRENVDGAGNALPVSSINFDDFIGAQ